MRRVSLGVTIVVTAFALLILPGRASSQGRRIGGFEVEQIGAREAVAGEILVKLRERPQPAQLGQLAAEADAAGLRAVGRSGLIRISSRTRSAAALLAALSKRADVAFVEPNYLVQALSEPGDPLFPQLWGLKNIGQPVNGGAPGTPGADMRAAEAWDSAIGSASNVVAVVDTGIDYTHGDLAQNMWSAPAPFTVTIGGVEITCAAGTHGFNAIAKTCDPMDDHNHGTHVAGTIGAVGNNANGVVGVNWVASIMGLKFLNAAGTGTIADAIDAVDFALQVKQIFSSSGGANIRVLSNSWGGGDFSQAFLDQINAAAAQDILFVAAAGNNGLPNDLLPMYPASYSAPNVVAVAATTNKDARAGFSNYGAKTVHLGAPGVDILSTVRGGGYSFASGTSMATPHVSGAAALTLSHCALDTSALKSLLVDSVDPVASMATTTISGGRLNVRRALQACSEPPATPTNVTAISGDRQVRLNWSEAAAATGYHVKRSTTSGGPYTTVASNLKVRQFTDTGLVNATTYYYVVSAVNVLGESAPSIEVSATPKVPADMVVSAFTVPGEGAAGSPVAISVTTKNQGAGTADPSTTKFFVSSNFTADPADTAVSEVHAVPSLAPGGTASASMTIVIPASVEPGRYYLVAKSDADDVLLESTETNNTLARSISIGPDLVASKPVVPAVAAPGAAIDVGYTITNKGAAPASQSLLNIYWSSNTTVDASDQVLAQVTIGQILPDQTQSAQVPIAVPPNAALGTYYIIARADAGSSVAESSESNNNAYATIRVGGDLIVDFVAPAAVGGGVPFVVTDTTTNAGSAAVEQSSTHFYLSPNAALSADDVLLSSRSVDGLEAGGVSAGATTLVVPADSTPGTYYLFAKADGANEVVETQENNNTDIRSVKVGPDLVASISSVPSSFQAGSTRTITESVTNKGAGDAAASTVKYYLSTNFGLDASDVELPLTRQVGVLVPNQSSASQTAIPIPAGTAPGSYYLIVNADGGEAVAESSETNNTYPRKIKVE